MKLLERIVVDDTMLEASNLPETDHAEYDASSTYSTGDRVISVTTHKIYEALSAVPVDTDPTDPANSSYWVEVSATNRWKAFDGVISALAERSSSITYSLRMPSTGTGVAFFGLSAGEVQIEVYDNASPAVLVQDVTVSLVDTTEVVDWFTFYFGGVDYDSEAVVTNLPAYTDFLVDITISGSGMVQVGEVVIGVLHELGVTSEADLSIQDYSRKERDDFGNVTLVERSFVDSASFTFRAPTADARRVKRLLARNRAKPAVWLLSETRIEYGATVFGFLRDFNIPLDAGGNSFVTAEVEGLV